MEKQDLGKTGIQVSSLCFGTSALGDMPNTYGYRVDEERARATIHAIFDGPANMIDSSRNYGSGRSEERIGAVLRERGGLPEGFVLSTKLDRDMETGRFDGDQARRSLEESLEALGLDHIPLLHLHDPEHARDLSEITGTGGALETLMRMKEEGLTSAVGLAMGRLDMMEALAREWAFDVVLNHNRYTLLNRSADALFAESHARGVPAINAAPFAGGVLAKGSAEMPRLTYMEASDEALVPVRLIEQACAKHGVAPGAVALQFSMRDPRIASTLIGVSKPERVTQALDWAAAPIPEALWADLAALDYAKTDPEADRVYTPG